MKKSLEKHFFSFYDENYKIIFLVKKNEDSSGQKLVEENIKVSYGNIFSIQKLKKDFKEYVCKNLMT